MAWDTVPAPNYASFDSSTAIGNALGNLVSDYQKAQQGQQQTDQNNYKLQQEKMQLDQSKAFAGGLPMNSDGTPNYAQIMKSLAEKGDINAIGSLAPVLQDQRFLQSGSQVSPLFGGAGGGSGGGSASRSGDAIPSDGSPAATLADNLATRIESKGQADPYGALGPVTKSGDRAYGKYQVMGDNIPSWTKEILGVEMTPDQFLADPKAQDMVARAKLGQYIEQTGSPQDAASMWFTGKPLAEGASLKDQNGVSGSQYASIATAGLGGGNRVASLGASDASAYATPETPKPPPVSAAAGSSIPRANATTAAGAVGAPGAQQPTPAPQQWAANNSPAMAGINAALPTGAGGAPSPAAAPQQPSGGLGSILGINPAAAAQPPAVQAGAAPAQAPAAPAQESVASIASAAGIPPNVAANIAKAVGVAPGAPLTPEQAARAKTIAQNYAARTGQQQQAPQAALQTPAGGQGQPQAQPQPNRPIMPQTPLPKGFTDPQKAILAIDQEIARLSPNPYARGQVQALSDWRDRIASSSAPMEVRPGMTIVDPRTGQTIFQTPAAASARTQALQGKADDIAQAIESGDQPPVLTGLYGVSPLVRSKLAEDGFDLSKRQIEWDAAKKQVQSLNGPQQVRFVGLANSVVNTIDEVSDLAQQMQLSGVPLLNKAKIEAYIQASGNSEGGQLATRYMTAVNTLKEEFANLANGGYAPTEPAWKLADQQINGNYGVKQLGSALTEAQRLIKYRLNAFPGLSSVGPGASNPYMPGSGQNPPQAAPPAVQGASTAPPAGHVEGGYRFKGGDPSKKENWEKAE